MFSVTMGFACPRRRLIPDGSISLSPAEQARWLPKFGNDPARLDALITVAGFVQANSGKSLDVQIRARLAGEASKRHDMDRRHQETIAKRGGSAPSPSFKPTAGGSYSPRDTSEKWEDYRARMIREGLWKAAGTA